MNKTLVIASVLMAAALTGVFTTTPMAAYAGGDYSGTDTEQKIKQKNVGGDGSSQFNCAENNIGEESAAEIDVNLCGTADISVLEDAMALAR
jgi:hypothetical protein